MNSGDGYTGTENAKGFVNSWTVGGKSWGTYNPTGGIGPINGTASTESTFTQWFTVTAAGEAWIDFYVNGTLSIDPPDVIYPKDTFYANYSFNAQTNNPNLSDLNNVKFGHSLHQGNLSSDPEKAQIAETQTWKHTFGASDVGLDFPVKVTLNTEVGVTSLADEHNNLGNLNHNPSLEPYLKLSSNFLDTGGISNFSSNLVPTPIPGTVWLFASGLIGLVGLRKKLKK